MSIYPFSAKTITGEEISLNTFKGKVTLIVNTASKCGFTPQYKELQELHTEFEKQEFTVLGFPCNQFGNQEPGTANEIKEFCQMNYGVSFPIFSKVTVKGEHIHPLFKYLTTETKGLLSNSIKWNFTKFLVDRGGNVVKRYSPTVKPHKLKKDIIKLLNENQKGDN